MKEFFTRILRFFEKWLRFFLNPRLLLCFGIGWMITNGWSYLFLLLGTVFDITWMTVAGGAWLGLLWLPLTPEKILSLLIAIFLLKRLFPNDEKTLMVLKEEFARAKAAIHRHREKKAKKTNPPSFVQQPEYLTDIKQTKPSAEPKQDIFDIKEP